MTDYQLLVNTTRQSYYCTTNQFYYPLNLLLMKHLNFFKRFSHTISGLFRGHQYTIPSTLRYEQGQWIQQLHSKSITETKAIQGLSSSVDNFYQPLIELKQDEYDAFIKSSGIDQPLKFADTYKNMEQILKPDLDIKKAHLAKNAIKLRRSNEDKIADYNTIQKRLNKKKIDPDAELPGMRVILAKRLFYLFFSLFFLGAEFPLTMSIITALFEISKGMSILTALTISGIVFISNHYYTKALNRSKIPLAVVTVLPGLLITLVQVGFRLQTDDGWYFVALCIAIYSLGGAMSAWHNESADLYYDQRKRRKLLASILHNEDLKEFEKLDQHELELKHQKKIRKAAEKSHKKSEKDYNKATLNANLLKEEVISLRQMRDEVKANCIAGITQASSDIKAQPANPLKKASKFAATLCLPLLMMFTGSCGLDKAIHDPQPSTELFIAFDKSASNGNEATQDLISIYNKTLEKFHLDDEDRLYEGRHLYVSTIGANNRPIVKNISLPAGAANPLERVEKLRLARIQDFRAQIKITLESFYSLPDTQQYTLWVEAQCSFLQRLMNMDTANHKELILIGDGVPSRPINFAAYKTREQFLQDFENIADAMDSYCDPGNLDNLLITQISSSNVYPRAVITPEDISSFWFYYYQRHHGRFQVLSNL